MTITFTKHGIEMMGFSEHSKNDSLEINFGIIRVYSLQGINFKPGDSFPTSEAVGFGDNCKIAVSQSINEACRLLTGNDFIDVNEEEWINTKKTMPPFVVIYFKECKTHILNGGYRKELDGNIITYDAFSGAKLEIKKWEKEMLPIIYTALVVNFYTQEKPVSLVPVERSIFGETSTGRTLFDVKMTGGATVVVSSGKDRDEINEALKRSTNLFTRLEYKSSRHLYAALNESDRLKQFMSYFLFIERHTHSQYKRLIYDDHASTVFNMPKRINQTANEFFKSRFNDSRNLAQRFHWCAIFTWQQLDDNDVNDFLGIKKVRDMLTHGEDIEEMDLPVEKTKMLALKLLGSD